MCSFRTALIATVASKNRFAILSPAEYTNSERIEPHILQVKYPLKGTQAQGDRTQAEAVQALLPAYRCTMIVPIEFVHRGHKSTPSVTNGTRLAPSSQNLS